MVLLIGQDNYSLVSSLCITRIGWMDGWNGRTGREEIFEAGRNWTGGVLPQPLFLDGTRKEGNGWMDGGKVGPHPIASAYSIYSLPPGEGGGR